MIMYYYVLFLLSSMINHRSTFSFVSLHFSFRFHTLRFSALRPWPCGAVWQPKLGSSQRCMQKQRRDSGCSSWRDFGISYDKYNDIYIFVYVLYTHYIYNIILLISYYILYILHICFVGPVSSVSSANLNNLWTAESCWIWCSGFAGLWSCWYLISWHLCSCFRMV